MERLITNDPIGGRRVVLHEDRVTGQLTQETTQDVSALVEMNKASFRHFDKRTVFKKRDGLIKVASIPAALWYWLKKQGIVDDEDRLLNWLDQPENEYWRTVPGKVSKR